MWLLTDLQYSIFCTFETAPIFNFSHTRKPFAMELALKRNVFNLIQLYNGLKYVFSKK